ncbi:MAG: DUF4126 domain-containing protein [Terriglobia bacterium]
MNPVASALGLGMLAGIRLYATVLVVGLLLRFGRFPLPPAWQHASVLADTRVLVLAGVACAIEFIADKVPWVDSAWDSIHTFIRPIGAALVASSPFSNLEPAYQVLLILLAGGMALTGHSAKATVRLAVNHSPEPFSNIALSLAEDASVAGGFYLLVKHPWVLAGIAFAFIALSAWLGPRIYRAMRAEWATVAALVRNWLGTVRAPQLTPAQQQWLTEHFPGPAPSRLLHVIGTADTRGLRNAVGTLCLEEQEAVFFTRRWGRLVARQIGPLHTVETRKGLLLDQLLLISADGTRLRFGLLAGQLKSAREGLAVSSNIPL